MPEPALAPLRPCCHLRFCGAGAAAEGVPQSALPDCDDGLFLCALTISHAGPDARIADSESCRPGRDCYVAPARAGSRAPAL
jgi:hypothetical protein